MSVAASALVEAAFRGLAAAPRQSVAAAVASLTRVVLGQSIANASTMAEEVVMRLEHITPVLAHKVAAGATADGAQASGNRRAARNVAEHVGLGEGTASLEKALLNPQRSQRGRRRPRVPGHQEPQTDTLGGDKIQHIAVASPKLTPLLRRQAARDWTHLRLQEVAPAVKETEGMSEGDDTTSSSPVEDSDHKSKDMHTTDDSGSDGNEAKEKVPVVPDQESVTALTTALRNDPSYGHMDISVLEDMARSFLIKVHALPDVKVPESTRALFPDG